MILLPTPDLISLSLSSRLAGKVKSLLPGEKLLFEFLHTQEEACAIKTIDEFIMALMEEMKKRKVVNKKFKTSPFKHRSMLVFIDDIMEIMMSSNKKTLLAFVEMLIMGAAFHMHFIMGASGIYRNLLHQIIHVNPPLQQKLKKAIQTHNSNQPLGAELVMNPDGLLFFREREEKVYRRLYPVSADGIQDN